MRLRGLRMAVAIAAVVAGGNSASAVAGSGPGQVRSGLPAPGPREFDIERHRGGLGS